MAKENLFSEYPRQVRVSTERSDLSYVRLPGYFAIHGRVPESWRPSVVMLLNDGKIAVCRGVPGDERAGLESVRLCPVYALGPDGPPAVPTGLVLVRFKEGAQVEGRRKEIARAGYTVREILSYAPHAAWLEARSGNIADALNGIPKLEALPDVVNVEPQMLTERVHR